MQIDYDPSLITYDGLLEIFWSGISPHVPTWSPQYKSVIFFGDEAQREAAVASAKSLEQETGEDMYVDILPLETFYLAEGYHQKYRLRARKDLRVEFETLYPDLNDFVNSTAVARVNGYLGGNGSREQLEAEVEALGLSTEGKGYLLERVAPILKELGVNCPVPWLTPTE